MYYDNIVQVGMKNVFAFYKRLLCSCIGTLIMIGWDYPIQMPDIQVSKFSLHSILLYSFQYRLMYDGWEKVQVSKNQNDNPLLYYRSWHVKPVPYLGCQAVSFLFICFLLNSFWSVCYGYNYWDAPYPTKHLKYKPLCVFAD